MTTRKWAVYSKMGCYPLGGFIGEWDSLFSAIKGLLLVVGADVSVKMVAEYFEIRSVSCSTK